MVVSKCGTDECVALEAQQGVIAILIPAEFSPINSAIVLRLTKQGLNAKHDLDAVCIIIGVTTCRQDARQQMLHLTSPLDLLSAAAMKCCSSPLFVMHTHLLCR